MKLLTFRLLEDNVARVPKEMQSLLGGCTKTQVYFQDAVLSMQQANHFGTLLLESIDDLTELGERTKFPQ